MIKRLAHLCFKTDQVDRMVRFYRDILGMRVKFTLTATTEWNSATTLPAESVRFLSSSTTRAVRQWGGEVVKLKSPADAPYQHFCLEIEGLETLRENLIARGIAVTEIAVGMDGSKQC